MLASCLQGRRRTPGATRFSKHGPDGRTRHVCKLPLTNCLGRVRLLHFAPASYFKPAIQDEPIKEQKRKKARKLYAYGPSGNIDPMF